ncbi:MAG: recombinase family protein [Candidatus Cybelea sp.]
MKTLVAYVRFGRGLQIEAQHADVEKFCRENGYKMAAEHADLALAIYRARQLRALLLIARLYPPSRDPAIIATLLEADGIEFRALDLPDANRLWLQAHKPVAEQEAKAHSDLIKESLRIAGMLGDVELGNPATRQGFPADALQKSAETRRTLRDRAMAAVAGKIVTLRAKGLDFGSIASALNGDGLRTVTDKRWRARSVEYVAKRIGGGTAVRIRRRNRREIRGGHRFISFPS